MTNKKLKYIAILKKNFLLDLELIQSIDQLHTIQTKYLGKHSLIVRLTKYYTICRNIDFPILKTLQLLCNYILNKIRKRFLYSCETIFTNIHDISMKIISKQNISKEHPIIKTSIFIIECLSSLGFELVNGPDVEHVMYNFDKLNILHDHTSRRTMDTFYIRNNLVLRTHTSSVQIRILSALNKIPIRIISWGKVYRNDDDTSHSPMFHQIEGLYIDKNISFSHLKGILIKFIYEFFKKKIKIRWRNSHFPFTEPSCEIDIECFKCIGYGCSLCKQSGWIEVMGAGLVQYNVLKETKFSKMRCVGFAFGIGIERFAMIYYRINNIKIFFENILQLSYIF